MNDLRNLRTGLGMDVHAFAPGRKLILGGVDIPHHQGLDGHSDADVLAHAISDALLGAVRGGDIGKLFPDTDPAYKDADSLKLLAEVVRFVRERGSSRVLLLELGVGEMTPGIITLPFWSMTAKLPDAHLLSVNISGDSAPLQLGSKAEAIQADLGALLSAARADD